MKTEHFEAPGLKVSRTFSPHSGAWYIAWKPYVSMWFTDRKALLKFVSWPPKTPTGDRLREWLKSFESDAPTKEATELEVLSPEVKATGFGPECHLDESDPNYQTRTVI
jgi:hypothetical protein